MTRLSDVQAPDIRSEAEIRQEAAQLTTVPKPGFIEAVDHSFNLNTVVAQLVRSAQRARFTLDPDFRLNEDLLKELSEGLPDHYIPGFRGAISEEHARFMRLQFLDLAESRNELSKLGLSGVALEIGAGVLDPAFLATGGLGASVAASKGVFKGASVGQRMVRGGLVAGASDLPLEAYLAASSPEFDEWDFAAAGAAAIVLGGVGGALVGDKLTKAARLAAKDAEWMSHRRAAMGAASGDEFLKDTLPTTVDRARAAAERILTNDGKKRFRRQLDERSKKQQIDAIISDLDLDEVEAQALRDLDPDEILYPVETRRPDFEREPQRAEPKGGDDGESTGPRPRMKLDLSWMRDTATKWAPIRFSMVGRLGSSKSRTARLMANALLNDTILKADNGISGQTVEEFVRLTDHIMVTDFYRVYNAGFGQFVREANIPGMSIESARREFARRVSLAIRRPEGEATADPIVNKVANHIRGLNEDLLGVGQAHGVRGFENVDTSRTYLTRIWNPMATRDAISTYGIDNVKALIREAMQRETPDLADDTADKIAGGFVRTLTKLDEYTDLDRARMFSAENADLLERVLKEELEGQVDDIEGTVRDIIEAVTPDRGKELTGRAKRRLNLDETHSKRMFDKDGNSIGVLTIEDLLENDVEKLFRLYSRQVAGASGISEFHRLFATVDEGSRVAGTIRGADEAANVDAEDLFRNIEPTESGPIDSEQFSKISDNHAEFESQVLQPLVSKSAITEEDAAILRAVMSKSDLQFANDVRLNAKGTRNLKDSDGNKLAGYAETYRVANNRRKVDIYVDINQRKQGVSAFNLLHEVGHSAFWNLDFKLQSEVYRIFKRLESSGELEKRIAKRYPNDPSAIRYFSDNEEEFFAEEFASYLISSKTHVKELVPIFDRIKESLRKALSRLLVSFENTKDFDRLQEIIEISGGFSGRPSTARASARPPITSKSAGSVSRENEIIPTLDTIISRVEKELKDAGASSKKISSEIERLRAAYDLVLGRPINKDTNVNSLLRTVRGYNYSNLSGQFGVAQVPEMGNVMGEMAIVAMSQQMPAFRQILKRAKNGQLTNEFLDELEMFTAQGTEWMRGRVLPGLDISDQGTVELAGGLVEQQIRRLGRASSVLSFMAPVNTALQRAAMASGVQNITNRAFRNRPPSTKRLHALGLSESDWDRIASQIKTHFTTEEGLLGRKVKRMNISSWTDQEAAAKLAVALDKWGRRTIQQGSIGEMALWMNKEWGKTLIQFRSFVLGAYEKQFLHRLDQRDLQAWMGFQWAMFLGGTAYIGQQYALSIGREDQEEYLAERLDPATIGAAAFKRSGASSLVPAAVDTTLRIAGQDGLFDKTRNTGLNADAFFGNPSMDLFDQVAGRAIPSTAQAALGQDPFTEKDAQRWMRVMPFRRVFGISNIYDAIAGQFPEDE